MENTTSVLVWSTLFLSAALVLLLNILKEKESRNCKLRPPGPPAWPIFGNFFDLGNMPHRSLYKLRARYGPVLWLRLGSLNTVVIQSAKAANEMFKNQDHIFCDRKVPDALTARNFYQGSLAFGRYGAYWRILRRLCASELLVNKRINDTAPIRRKCIDKTIQCIENDVAEARARGELGQVDLSHYLFLMAFSLIGSLTLSRELLSSQSKQGLEFFAAMIKSMKWVGKPNMSDYFPFLRSLDPQGIRRNMRKDLGCALKIVSGYVKERVDEQKLRNDEIKDLLDGLIKYEGDGKEGPDRLSDQNINIIIAEMFLAGSESTSSTMEWAVVELLRNPEAMRKTKCELDRVVGRNRNVEEKDIDELPYFKAVLKETLRLHPPFPLLLPRNAMKDTEFMGYQIPKDTQVFVNVWAIGRDPECWENPLSFKPERFLGSNVDFKGQHFELIPFGSGRRICVAITLADRVLHLGLASLLHHFDWELGQDATPESLDMTERFGLAARKLLPLRVIPKKRTM